MGEFAFRGPQVEHSPLWMYCDISTVLFTFKHILTYTTLHMFKNILYNSHQKNDTWLDCVERIIGVICAYVNVCKDVSCHGTEHGARRGMIPKHRLRVVLINIKLKFAIKVNVP